MIYDKDNTPKIQVNLHPYKLVHYILYINYNKNKGYKNNI